MFLSAQSSVPSALLKTFFEGKVEQESVLLLVLQTMLNNNSEQRNFTQDVDYGQSPNTFYNIKGRLGTMVDQAIFRSNLSISDSKIFIGRLKQRIEKFLADPLRRMMIKPYGDSHMDQTFRDAHHKIEGAVEGAVDSSMQELNITVANSAVRDSLVATLDSEIESAVFSEVFSNATHAPEESSDFFHSLPIKDETIFVALVSMGVVIPIIFITLLVLFLYKRHKEIQTRRQAMLLRNHSEFSMDECSSEDKSSFDEKVPDLDLKYFRL